MNISIIELGHVFKYHNEILKSLSFIETIEYCDLYKKNNKIKILTDIEKITSDIILLPSNNIFVFEEKMCLITHPKVIFEFSEIEITNEYKNTKVSVPKYMRFPHRIINDLKAKEINRIIYNHEKKIMAME